MPSRPEIPSTLRGGRGRRLLPLTVLVMALLLAAAVLPRVDGVAGAATKRCPGGEPPPCADTEPEPETTTSTSNPSSPPPPPAWTATISVLDQRSPGVPYNTALSGAFVTTGQPRYATPTGDVVWPSGATTDDQKNEGTLSLPSVYLPEPHAVFVARSLGDDGMICRSQTFGSVPPSGRSVHVLLAPTVDKTRTDIGAMANGFIGRVTPDPADAEVTVTTATLVDDTGGLLLTIGGRVKKDAGLGFHFYGNFLYMVLLHVELPPPTAVGDPHQVLAVHADQGDLVLTPDSPKDDVLEALGDDPEPDFRSAVQRGAADALNDSIAAQPDVAWFSALGYTVSVRKVTLDDAGLHVIPSLCKVD